MNNANNADYSVNITSISFENEINLKIGEREDSDLSFTNRNKKNLTNKEKEFLIENDAEVLKDILRNNIIINSEDTDSLKLFIGLVDGDYKLLLLKDLLSITTEKEEVLTEILEEIITKYENNHTHSILWLTNEINEIIRITPSEELGSTGSILSNIFEDKYYTNPIICKEIILSVLNKHSRMDSNNLLEIYSKLTPNMKDDRIIKNVFNIAMNDKKFISALQIGEELSIQDDIEIYKSKASEKMIQVLKTGKIEEITNASNLIQKTSNNQINFIDILNEFSDYFPQIKRFLMEDMEDKTDKEICEQFGKWINKNNTQLTDLKYSPGIFSEDLSNMPITTINRRIKDHYKNVYFEEFAEDIKKIIKDLNNSSRATEILEITALMLVKNRPKFTIEILNLFDDGIEKEKRKRIIAIAQMEIGNYQEAIRTLSGSINQTTITLKEQMEENKRLLEQGFDLRPLDITVRDFTPKFGKILYNVHSSLPFVTSGYTTRTKYLTEALEDDGVEIVVNSRWGFPSDRLDLDVHSNLENEIEIMGIKHLFSPDENGFNKFKMEKYSRKAAMSIVENANKEKVSILHSASDYSIGLATAIAAKTLKIPFIYEMRGLWALSRTANNPEFKDSLNYKIMLRLERQCAENADYILAISEGVRDILIQWGIRKEKIMIVPNCISRQDFDILKKDMELVEKYDLKNVYTFGYVGSLVPYEGLDFLIETINKMDKNMKNKIQILIVGEGIISENLKQLVREYGLEDKIIFTGRVPHSDIKKYYSLIDSLIIPRMGDEVCEIIPSLKPLEGMGMRKLVLCSDVGPSKTLIEGNSNGILFKKEDCDSLSEKISNIVQSPDKYSRIAIESEKWVKENRNWNIYTKDIIEIYRFLEIFNLAESRSNKEKQIREKLRKIINDNNKMNYEEIYKITDISMNISEKRTASNLFLASLRTIGEKDTEKAIKYGERYLSYLGDLRSVKSLLSYYRRKKLDKNNQKERILPFSPPILRPEIEPLIQREMDKIRLTEEPVEYEFLIDEIDPSSDSRGQFKVEGSLLTDKIEDYSGSLIQFEFYDDQNNRINSPPQLLVFSNSVGWYSYIHKEKNTDRFNLEFIVPEKTFKVKIGIRTWRNKKNIYILSDINIKISDIKIYQDKIVKFSEYVKSCNAKEVIFIFSGTTFMQKIRANRPIRLAYEIESRSIPVLFNYHRWNSHEEIPNDDNELLIQIPIDITERLIEEIAELDFGNKIKQFMISYPHPCIPKILNRYKLNGWNVIYDARDDWEEFASVGQAKWYNESNEKYIVCNSHHVTAVSWPLASKLDSYGPLNNVVVVPNALGEGFLQENYAKKESANVKIGYFGHLSSAWFNWEALIEIAKRKRGIIFEIIGHSEPEGLSLPENIILLGPRTHPEINIIASEWKIGIIPFTVSKLSDAVDPIKIYEYLALGLPTISFRMPQIDDYPYVKTVGDIDDFCEEIDVMLKCDIDQQKIIEWLSENTWRDRVNVFLERNERRKKGFLGALE